MPEDVDPQGIRFLCGYKPGSNKAITKADLTKHERKVLKQFRQFLRGEGSRCTLCLHKATKHINSSGCGAKNCDCPMGRAQVKAVRARAKVQGWEND